MVLFWGLMRIVQEYEGNNGKKDWLMRKVQAYGRNSGKKNCLRRMEKERELRSQIRFGKRQIMVEGLLSMNGHCPITPISMYPKLQNFPNEKAHCFSCGSVNESPLCKGET